MEPVIETFSGKMFNIVNIDTNNISIDDISHSLSMQCRYTGHCRYFYSIAEHSVAVADYLHKKYRERRLTLAGLLHDACEAYLSDISSPEKQLLPEYKKLEYNLSTIIGEVYNVDFLDPRIKEADIVMLSQEAHQLLPSMGNTWDWSNWGGRPALVEPIVGLPPPLAEKLFMSWFKQFSLEPQVLVVNG